MPPAVSMTTLVKIVSAEKYLRERTSKRFSRYSGMVEICDRMKNGIRKIAMKTSTTPAIHS